MVFAHNSRREAVVLALDVLRESDEELGVLFGGAGGGEDDFGAGFLG